MSTAAPVPLPPSLAPDRDEETVDLFKRFLRIRSTSHEGPSSGSYAACVSLLKAEAEKRGMTTRVVEAVEGRPVLVATIEGTDPSLPSVLLNSHYDVVPVMEEHWTMAEPWAGEEVDGQIFGRGTQDMKCVVVQHLEALHRVVEKSGRPRRTVHITAVPDEEIGGAKGLGEFVAQGHLDALNVGVALDEGLANPIDEFTVFFAERAVWWIEIRAKGPTGHGSRFVKNTAIERLLKSVNLFLEERARNEAKLDGHGCTHATKLLLGDVVTINCTMLDAGVSMDGGKTHALNVIPDEARAGFDIRVPPSVPLEDMEKLVLSWTQPHDVEVNWVFKTPEHVVSETDVDKNPWWGIFTGVFNEIKMPISPEVFPAGTDSRYIRMKGIPAFGFSPMRNTPILLHDHNERISRQVFCEGVSVFERVIGALANAPKLTTE